MDEMAQMEEVPTPGERKPLDEARGASSSTSRRGSSAQQARRASSARTSARRTSTLRDSAEGVSAVDARDSRRRGSSSRRGSSRPRPQLTHPPSLRDEVASTGIVGSKPRGSRAPKGRRSQLAKTRDADSIRRMEAALQKHRKRTAGATGAESALQEGRRRKKRHTKDDGAPRASSRGSNKSHSHRHRKHKKHHHRRGKKKEKTLPTSSLSIGVAAPKARMTVKVVPRLVAWRHRAGRGASGDEVGDD